jgi:hypothetical protein
MHHPTTVDVDRLTGDVLRVIRGKEGRHRGILIGHLPAPEMRNLLDLFGSPFVKT